MSRNSQSKINKRSAEQVYPGELMYRICTFTRAAAFLR
jgi:hypothetical protein